MPLTIEEKVLSGLPYDIWFPFEETVHATGFYTLGNVFSL